MDVSSAIVIGVPLTKLGEYTETTEDRRLFDEYGEPTGETRTITHSFWKTIDGRTREFGEEDFSNHPRETAFDFDNLVSDSSGETEWVHLSDDEAGYEQVVIGKHMKECESFELDGGYEAYSGATTSHLLEQVAEVADFLREQFGYEGEVLVLSVVGYSY